MGLEALLVLVYIAFTPSMQQPEQFELQENVTAGDCFFGEALGVLVRTMDFIKYNLLAGMPSH